MFYESDKTDINDSLGVLEAREAEITRLYYRMGNEHPLTLEEIGQRCELTRERVRQIKGKALRMLRQEHRSDYLKAHNGQPSTAA